MVSLLLSAIRDTLLSVALPLTVLLFLVAYVEEAGILKFERFLRRTGRAQPVLGALLAAIPGCATTVTLTRLYGVGAIGVGTLYAAHFATLGDAAFILWSARPLTTLALTGIVVAVGVLLGLAIEGTPARDKLMVETLDDACDLPATMPPWAVYGWFALLVAGVVTTILWPHSLLPGAVGAALALTGAGLLRLPRRPGLPKEAIERTVQRVARDAAEIVAWVVLADVLFTFADGALGGALVDTLQSNVLLDVVIAAALGLIPGCGPQIVVASLFVAGDLPFAALVANTLSQHGDAIFPLLGVQRRVATHLTIAGGAVGLLAGLAAALLVH